MTKHDLKELAAIGAELGAAKAEVERLRGLLEAALYYVPSNKTELRTLIDNSLSQQAEPECEWPTCECALEPERCKQCDPSPSDTFTAVDMATAAAQGFRDGQAAVEKSAAKDETEPVYQFQWREIGEGDWMACSHSWFRFCEASPEHDTRVVEVARPAQTEQQPVGCRYRKADGADRAWTYSDSIVAPTDGYEVQYLAPIAPPGVVGFRDGRDM